MSATQEKNARRHQVAIRVYCHDDERERIKEKADEAGVSVSEYLRYIGQGYAVQSQVDKKHIQQVGKLASDLGKIGGLLKAILTNDERFKGIGGQQLKELTKAVLTDLKKTQDSIRQYIDDFDDIQE